MSLCSLFSSSIYSICSCSHFSIYSSSMSIASFFFSFLTLSSSMEVLWNFSSSKSSNLLFLFERSSLLNLPLCPLISYTQFLTWNCFRILEQFCKFRDNLYFLFPFSNSNRIDFLNLFFHKDLEVKRYQGIDYAMLYLLHLPMFQIHDLSGSLSLSLNIGK